MQFVNPRLSQLQVDQQIEVYAVFQLDQFVDRQVVIGLLVNHRLIPNLRYGSFSW